MLAVPGEAVAQQPDASGKLYLREKHVVLTAVAEAVLKAADGGGETRT